MTRSRAVRIRNNIEGWSFVLPAVLFLFVLMIYPIIHTFILSFQKYNFVYDSKSVFVGLNNYIKVLKDDTFKKAFFNTLYFAAVYIPLIFVLGFFVGLIFSRYDMVAGRVSKVVLFIPMVIPISMSSFMFLFMLNPQWGIVNSLFKDYLKLPNLARDWMNDPSTAMNMILLVTVWWRVGFIGLLFLSGIQAIPESVIEASIIDGANGWKRIMRIVLPNLRETYLVIGILAIVTSIKLFAQVVAMTGTLSPQNAGGPAKATLTLYVATWKSAFLYYDLGIGAAMGYIMSIIIVALFAINFFINKSEKA
ncbi:MAG: sugar ABC transporter permease [Spirochaetales bacterium]|nr:sugar ABC transporter permease [Spirochaetales bacterium]